MSAETNSQTIWEKFSNSRVASFSGAMTVVFTIATILIALLYFKPNYDAYQSCPKTSDGNCDPDIKGSYHDSILALSVPGILMVGFLLATIFMKPK